MTNSTLPGEQFRTHDRGQVPKARRPIGPPWSPSLRVATGKAAVWFSVAGVVTVQLTLVAAALLVHGSDSSAAMIAAVACLAAAVICQVVARRWLRGELVREAYREGLDDPKAHAGAAMDRWTER